MSAPRPIEAVWAERRTRHSPEPTPDPERPRGTSGRYHTDWHGYWRTRTYLDGEWGVLGHADRWPPAQGPGGSHAVCASPRIRAALLALSLAISASCAQSTVTATFDAEGRLTACRVATYEFARVLEAECSKDTVKVKHEEESGWAGKAISAIGGWLAGKVGL